MQKLTNSQIDAQITAEDLGFVDAPESDVIFSADTVSSEAGENNMNEFDQNDTPPSSAFERGCGIFAIVITVVAIISFSLCFHAGH